MKHPQKPHCPRRAWHFIIVPLVLTSCNPIQLFQSDDDPSSPYPPPKSFMTPVPLKLADSACQGQEQEVEVGEWVYLTAHDGRLQSKLRPFTASSGGTGLVADGVLTTYWGQHILNDNRIIAAGGAKRRSETQTMIAPARFLKLCGPVSSDDHGLVENAGLSVLTFVETGMAAAASAGMLSYDESNLELNIVPAIESRYLTRDGGSASNFTVHETDNAVWSLFQSGEGENLTRITLYPQSQEARDAGLYGGLPLYYLPFTTLHEYGHEVFFQLLPSYYDALGKDEAAWWGESVQLEIHRRWNRDHLMPAAFTGQMNAHAATFLGDGAKAATALSALSEAFGDLYAYNVLEESERDLAAYACMSHRDPRQRSLNRQRPKRLSEEVLQSFLLQQPQEGEPEYLEDNPLCQALELRDVHVVGAILAHNIQDLLDRRMDSNGGAMLILKEWLTAFNDVLRAQYFDLGARSLLSVALIEFIEAASRSKPLDALDCANILENLTPFFFEWKERGIAALDACPLE